MKSSGQKGVFAVLLSVLTVFSFILMQNAAFGYRISDMVLRDSSGNPIALGSNTPYSPKQTCGTVNCHIDMVRSFGMSSGNIYESEIAFASRDHGPGTSPYATPYAQRGVSAGYHFQTGNNLPWGDVQRNFYQDLAFSASPGMYGGYCASYGRRLADLTESSAPNFDMSSYDFARTGCGWCHGGGGPLEYDREGYRYNGTPGLFQTGPNSTPEWGDYYSFDPSTSSLVNKTAESQSGGVAEVDCLLCHLRTDGTRYGLIERNFALSEPGSPGLAASLGLAGAAGTTGYLSIPQKAADGQNPIISTASWSWTTVALDHAVITSPPKENCALCHFADKSFVTPGPAGVALGFTSFQKILAAGSFQDGDSVGGGMNAGEWKKATPRAGAGYRSGSINDPYNPDIHMDGVQNPMKCTTCHYLLGTARDYGTDCQYCHYEYWGYSSPPDVTPVTPAPFADLTDQSGNIIQPGVGVLRIDHQFAKGDSELKSMDQLGNTATCASCHVDRTHPNSGDARGIGVHNGIPRFHFDKINCRVCHIPVLNGPVDENVIDHTVGSYQTFERTQTTEAFNSGINKRPLYLWRATSNGKGPLQIQPFNIVTSAGWANAASQNGEDAASIDPAFERIGQKAAERLRDVYGDTDGDGVYDWTLNRPQGGDTTLIVNTPAEIADFINQIGSDPAAPANPVINFAFTRFSISHNLRPRGEIVNPILGSSEGGGCVMCHASSNPASPYYSPQSVGFFDKMYELFKHPLDGGSGLVQTVLAANPPLAGNLKRVVVRFPYKKQDNSEGVADISNSGGQTVGNAVNQGEVLGYDALRREALMSPKSTSYTITASAGPNGSIMPGGAVQVAAGQDQYFSMVPNTGYHVEDVKVNGTSIGAVSTYTFTFVVAAHTIEATFAPNPTYTITATAGPNGTIAPPGATSVLEGSSLTYTITPDPGYRVASVAVDGVAVVTTTTYNFTNITANHTITASFTPDVFIITATAYGGGTIVPAGQSAVPRGGSQSYTITPNSGYSISYVTVDGVNKGAISSYTFTNVTSAHKIKAYFRLL